MKKLILFLFVLLIVTIAYSVSAKDNEIWMRIPHNAVTISASGTSESVAYALGTPSYRPTGFFSLQYVITGAGGTLKFEYQVSNDCVNFVNTGTDIGSGLTSSSGPGSDGKDLLAFSPESAMCMNILATETGGASAVTVTTHLFIQ